ncbi:MAG TPA: hypothetical protein VHM67_03225 [Gemmatimonadaceae bacterium]|nr:hypothetical protein [Gemmatimonadaceae bacterium]
MSQPISDVQPFLGTARAQSVCNRELDRLVTTVADRLSTAADLPGGATAEVRRSPGRCIVQLGPVALTMSWVRGSVDTVLNGRLMVVEWRGTVGRPNAAAPEQRIASRAAQPARVVHETVLIADATSERDWLWRREDADGVAFASTELATRCVDSLVRALRDGPVD